MQANEQASTQADNRVAQSAYSRQDYSLLQIIKQCTMQFGIVIFVNIIPCHAPCSHQMGTAERAWVRRWAEWNLQTNQAAKSKPTSLTNLCFWERNLPIDITIIPVVQDQIYLPLKPSIPQCNGSISRSTCPCSRTRSFGSFLCQCHST